MKRILFLSLFLIFLSCQGSLEENSISIGYMGTFETLDPHLSNDLVTFSINSNIFESIVKFDENMVVLPSLAASWENPDTRTWTFYIREGVFFHNGDSLTAEDVKFSILRAMNHPQSQLKGSLLKVEGVVVKGNAVSIYTEKPDFPLLNKLVTVPIVQKGYFENNREEFVASHPVGTGPYRYYKWTTDSSLVLRRNERYWGKSAEFETVFFRFYTNLEHAVNHLESEDIDILDNFPCDEIDRIRNLKNVELVYTPSLSVRYIGFNMSSSPLQKKQVRKAIYHAINRATLIDSVRKGYAKEATQMLNPRVYGYNPEIELIDYDTLTAKELLREGGYENGFRLRFVYFEARKKLGEMVKNDLEKVGINVELVPLSANTFYSVVKKGNFDAFVASFISISGDAEQALYEKIHSPDREKGYGLMNLERFKNDTIDLMIESLDGIDSPNERLRKMQEIMALVMDEIPSVPLFVSEDLYAKNKNIEWKPRIDRLIMVSEIKRKVSAE
jgi:peptide/nickel transport system substrate-binding protein